MIKYEQESLRSVSNEPTECMNESSIVLQHRTSSTKLKTSTWTAKSKPPYASTPFCSSRTGSTFATSRTAEAGRNRLITESRNSVAQQVVLSSLLSFTFCSGAPDLPMKIEISASTMPFALLRTVMLALSCWTTLRRHPNHGWQHH